MDVVEDDPAAVSDNDSSTLTPEKVGSGTEKAVFQNIEVSLEPSSAEFPKEEEEPSSLSIAVELIGNDDSEQEKPIRLNSTEKETKTKVENGEEAIPIKSFNERDSEGLKENANDAEPKGKADDEDHGKKNGEEPCEKDALKHSENEDLKDETDVELSAHNEKETAKNDEIKEESAQMESDIPAATETVNEDENASAPQKDEAEAIGDQEKEEPPTKTVRFAAAAAETTPQEQLLQLDECERLMRENTQKALKLVDRLRELELEEQKKQQKPAEPSAEISAAHKERKASLEDGDKEREHRKIEICEGADIDADSYRVNSSILKSPVGCVISPDGNILIIDEELGLLIFSLEQKQLIKGVSLSKEKWRSPKCIAQTNNGKEILLLLDYNINQNGDVVEEKEGALKTPELGQDEAKKEDKKEELIEDSKENVKEQGPEPESVRQQKPKEAKYRPYICRFSAEDLTYMDRIEIPKYLLERVVVSCCMCSVEQTGCIYLAANTPSEGFLYELSAPTSDGKKSKWIEIHHAKNSNYSTIQAFAVVHPVTELFVIETNRSYVQLISVYNSRVVNVRMIGLCERPGSLCMDDRGNVFVFDRASSRVSHYSRTYFQKVQDVALVDRAHCQLFARSGLLAVLCRLPKELRLYKYDPNVELFVFG